MTVERVNPELQGEIMREYQYSDEIYKERSELELKRKKLAEFKMSRHFTRLPWQDQELLNTYGHIMTMYSGILSARISALFCEETAEDKGAVK